MLLRHCPGEPAVRRAWRGVGVWVQASVWVVMAGTVQGRAPATKRLAPVPTNLVSGEVRGWSLPYRKEGELKARLSGASARPLPGGELEIRELRVETFRENEPVAVLTTPLCRYRQGDDTVISTNTFTVQLSGHGGQLEGQGFRLQLAAKDVSSPGRFTASGPNGRPQLGGVGFLFRLEARQLTVSNQVQLLIPVRVPKRFRP